MSVENQKVWEGRIYGAVRVKQPEDVQAIAMLCMAAQERGEQAAVWHEAARFYGYMHRCNCFPCSEKRRAA